MQGWSLKTKQERSDAIESVKYNILFRYVLPSESIAHFERTKNILLARIFTNDAISFQTLSDYYLNFEAANQAVGKLIKESLLSTSEGNYYQSACSEKLKNALFFADERGVNQIPWFLK